MKTNFESIAEFFEYVKNLQLESIDDVSYLLILRNTCIAAAKNEKSIERKVYFHKFIDNIDARLKNLNVILITEENFEESLNFLSKHLPCECIAEELLKCDLMNLLDNTRLEGLYRFCRNCDFDEEDVENPMSKLFDMVCEERYRRQKLYSGISLN